jgi:hypothetical protein
MALSALGCLFDNQLKDGVVLGWLENGRPAERGGLPSAVNWLTFDRERSQRAQ